MSTNPASHRSSTPHRAGDEPGVYRLRVFYLCVNGRRSVVGDWQLYDTMRRLKLLNMYSELDRLGEAGSLEFYTTVHGAPLAVSVVVGTWQVRLGPGAPANRRQR